ncbi:hypothetical protein [Psychroflexus aestuariivivens]|uniref:hypothetical protein n=1 Tax=Psychroflexus aestuariivivens TaxID=1795040 RepID=UPI000FD886D5|nr:hypothetical protein [Psychroflexus aestuariivivens]
MKTLLFIITFLIFSNPNSFIEEANQIKLKSIEIATKNKDGSYEMNENIQNLIESAEKFLNFEIDNIEIIQDQVEDSKENYIFLLLTSEDNGWKLATRIFEKNQKVYPGTEQFPIQNLENMWLAPNAVVCHGCINGCNPKLYKFESQLSWFCTNSETKNECLKSEAAKLQAD